jgi:hypothetical protein
LLHDNKYHDSVKIKLLPDNFDPMPSELGRIVSIKIGEVETITNSVTILPEGYSTEAKFTIDEGSSKIVTFEYTTWLKVGAPQIIRPQRVVEQFQMDIVSQCDQSPRVEIDSDPRGVVTLLFNQPLSFPLVQGVSPGEKVGGFKLLSPP